MPSKTEIAAINKEIADLKTKIAEIGRLEQKSSGTQKMNAMVRKMSIGMRLSSKNISSKDR